MKKIAVLLLFPLIFVQSIFSQIPSAQKLIVTITEDWNGNKAKVYLFDRTKDTWKKQRGEFSVSIGDSGLGWGIGVHPEQQGEFVKQEGDSRSPAGIFELDTVLYGLNPSAPEGVRFPYRQLTMMTRCIDDTASQFYNSIVEEGSITKDWNSAEEMNNVDPDYSYVLAIRHNVGSKKGKGSCIFFHINNIPTSGCTSMDEADMLTLLHWLDPKQKTYIVQLPHAEYHRLRQQWNLPKLKNQ
ncbi:MAG: L,D-transpeptidase family protein [Bacteriovoracaceae bacterium]